MIIAGNGVRIAQGYEQLRATRRAGRAAGGDDGGRQGQLCRDPSAGAGRVRHVRHRGGQCLPRRGRSGAGRRLETQRRATPPGRTPSCSTRRGRAFIQIDIEPQQRLVELPGRDGRARRCGAGPGAALRSGAAARGRPRRAAGGRGASRGIARRTAISTTPAYIGDDKPILPQRVIGELMRNLPR